MDVGRTPRSTKKRMLRCSNERMSRTVTDQRQCYYDYAYEVVFSILRVIDSSLVSPLRQGLPLRPFKAASCPLCSRSTLSIVELVIRTALLAHMAILSVGGVNIDHVTTLTRWRQSLLVSLARPHLDSSTTALWIARRK